MSCRYLEKLLLQKSHIYWWPTCCCPLFHGLGRSMVPPVLIWLQSRHLPRQPQRWRVSCLTWHRWLNRQWPRREQQQIRKPFQRMQYEAWIEKKTPGGTVNKKKEMGKENLFKLAWDICLDKNFTCQFWLLSHAFTPTWRLKRCHTVSSVPCQMAIFVTLPGSKLVLLAGFNHGSHQKKPPRNESISLLETLLSRSFPFSKGVIS